MAGYGAEAQILDPTQPKRIFVATDQAASVDDLSEPVEAMKLQGLLTRKGSRVAIISGLPYSKGDKINGYRISEIKDDHVVVVGSGIKKRLYVYE